MNELFLLYLAGTPVGAIVWLVRDPLRMRRDFVQAAHDVTRGRDEGVEMCVHGSFMVASAFCAGALWPLGGVFLGGMYAVPTTAKLVVWLADLPNWKKKRQQRKEMKARAAIMAAKRSFRNELGRH